MWTEIKIPALKLNPIYYLHFKMREVEHHKTIQSAYLQGIVHKGKVK